ncbi:MAG: alpha/beta fold hydrolase [Pseudomonadota bacterium]
MKRLFSLVLLSLSCHAQALVVEPYQFVAADGTAVAAEKGSLLVPERHAAKAGKQMTLRFVRFKSTAAEPGAPIVYLAGGPGGSGIQAARGERFPLFMKLREVADVIVVDQRGTGESGSPPDCVPPGGYPLEKPLQLDAYLADAKKAAALCAAFWRDAGVDIDAYTSRESAADLAMLRTALGVPKVSLFGISYGTHLALATAKYHPDAVAALVLASSEGLGQTVKQPARIDLMLGRLARLAAAKYPDFLGSMARVHQRLDLRPVVLGKTGIGKLDIQLLASYMIKNPREAAMLPALYAAMEADQFQFVAPHVARLRGQLARWQAMPVAMDASIGIDRAHLQLVLKQAETSLLGRASDLPHPDIAAALGIADLGAEYRREPATDIPALFIAGTLDGRTVLESQLELARGMPRAQTLVVHNAGHDLLVVSPAIGEAMVRFLRGEKAGNTEIVIDPPAFM